jgi:pre-mRNA-splicing factor SYF2
MDDFKPDHKLYNAQRAAASAVNPSMALLASTSYAQQAAHDDLYRDANSFVYGDHKPSEDAIDKVIGKINVEYVPSTLSPSSTPD